MLVILAIVLVLIVVLGPSAWAKHILKKHSTPREDFPGTGGELANHFIMKYELEGVTVEETDRGDHYNPETKSVGLTESVFNQKSLTAVAVAAHEIGHAVQDHRGYKPLKLRTRMAEATWVLEKLGIFMIMCLPFVAALTQTPALSAVMFIGGMLALGTSVVVHLVTLPVEFDASFKRALPMLESGYLSATDLHDARQILLACALTYVAASLASLLNFWRWIAILRR